METARKVLKSKTVKEALMYLPYSFLDVCAFGLIMWFALQPFLRKIQEILSVDVIAVRWRLHNYYVLAFGVVIVIMYYLKRRQDGSADIKSFLKKNIPITLFFVFMILMTVSTVINGISRLSLFGSNYRAEGFLGYCSYIVYFLLAYIISSKKLKDLWIYFFTSSATLLHVVQLVDFCTNEDFYYNYFLRSHYIFDQYNHLGYYIMMALAIQSMMFITAEKKWVKALFLAEFAFSVLSLLINDTFGCQLAVIAGLVFAAVVYSIAKGKFKVITLVPLIVFALTLTGAYFASDRLAKKVESNYLQIVNDTAVLSGREEETQITTGVARIILWKNTWNYVLEKPILGHSADATGDRLLADTNDNDRCHCEYLNYAVCFGIPAAIIYFAAVFSIYLRGLKHKNKLTDYNLIGLCSAFTYLASAVVGNTMFYTAPFLFIMLGFGYPHSKQKN